MNLSLTTVSREEEEQDQRPVEGSSIEKEHMFDKVVTPSDVGKLNRLVIPKQYAERYFPLDSSSNEKGLLLNFEDRTGKSWRFRYSYWNSSQSYVMTKGWSRFVKDKKLDAGDIVSFQRGVGEIGRERLFIDWRRRPKVPDPTSMVQFGGAIFPRFYSFPPPVSIPRNYENFHRFNRGSYDLSYNPRYHFQFPQELGYGYGDQTTGRFYMGSLEQNRAVAAAMGPPLVIDSVPVVHGRAQRVAAAAAAEGGTTGKRLRLFGVEMECGSTVSTEEESSSSGGSMPRGAMGTSSSSSLALRLASSEESSIIQSAGDDHFSKKGKSSLSFDLDR